MTLLLDVSFQVNIPEEQKWLTNQGDGYTVRGVYQVLTNHECHTLDATLDNV